MSPFQFTATEVFGLHGRGIVFRGRVVSGSAARGERVRLRTRDGGVTARVALITEQHTIIAETAPGREINFLLAEFDREDVNQAIRSAVCDECDPRGVPPPAELLNIELPCTLEAADD